MRAYLVGGPANGREIEVPDGQQQIYVPVPLTMRVTSFDPTSYDGYDAPGALGADFQTVVYRKSFQLRNGGYVFEIERAPEPKADFGTQLKTYLRQNPGALGDEIRRAVRSMIK